MPFKCFVWVQRLLKQTPEHPQLFQQGLYLIKERRPVSLQSTKPWLKADLFLAASYVLSLKGLQFWALIFLRGMKPHVQTAVEPEPKASSKNLPWKRTSLRAAWQRCRSSPRRYWARSGRVCRWSWGGVGSGVVWDLGGEPARWAVPEWERRSVDL